MQCKYAACTRASLFVTDPSTLTVCCKTVTKVTSASSQIHTEVPSEVCCPSGLCHYFPFEKMCISSDTYCY